MIRGLLLLSLLVALAAAPGARPAASRPTTEVVVTLAPPPLGRATDRRAAVRRLDAAQHAFVRALRRTVPRAHVRWRYRLVLDGLAVVLPTSEVGRLGSLPGVREVLRSAPYGVSAGPAVDQIGATALWAPGLANAGDGIKIGIIDGGVDQRHPFFDPAGYTMPPGFPKGQRAFTTAKVIVARAFPAPGQSDAALVPFDPQASSTAHGTHVAGIAAGNAGTRASGDRTVSGVAPRAYLGNYRALTVPTDSGAGEDGNAPELVAAIEAAVADGMDVINLSIGEPEIEPSRDAVALALDGAARAGVVPVVAAGNDFEGFGRGSLSSPGNSAEAITVGAVTTADAGPSGVVADFTGAGPTALSLRLKPDVAAPGVNVLSAVPGGWETLSGTSMAAPHVAGAAALLRERHPDWSVSQLKAALVETGDAASADDTKTAEALPARAGGGVIDLPRADRPLLFAAPSSLSLGYLHPGQTASRELSLADAGGGAGSWTASLERFGEPAGIVLAVPPTVEVPGPLTFSAEAAPDASEKDVTGFVLLQKDGETRRIPFWLRVTRPALATERATPLSRSGLYRGDTRGRPSLVSTYRYPDIPARQGLPSVLAGPEQVFRVTLRRPVANFGVAIVSRAPGVGVVPRVVANADENRLTGYAGLPLVINPYLAGLDDPVPAAGAIRPLAGTYDVVFDSRTAAGAGRFSFRFWVNDVTPPSIRLLARSVRREQPLRLATSDGGSGVDRAAVDARLDGVARRVTFEGGVLEVDTAGLPRGRHRLRVQVSDYQETRNMENVAAVLPNTRRLTETITIR